jgi:hypothetical protein
VREPLWNDPEYIRSRLPVRFFGFTEADLHDALRAGYLAMDFCTASHPPSYKGAKVWGEAHAFLRERGRVLGGASVDHKNIPRIESPDRSTAITIVAGNEHTGSLFRSPSTKRPRKKAGVRIIICNAQTSLFMAEAKSVSPATIQQSIWYLLHHRHGSTVTCELSLPGAVDERGFVVEWIERIILASFDLGDQLEGGDDSDSGPLVVPVTRRG